MPPRASKRLAKGRGEAEDSAPLPTAPTAPPPLVRKQKKAVNQPKAVDRLSFLSSELLAVILHQLSPATAPDLLSLFHFATVSKHLAVHVKTHLYRSLSINTRTDAHAVHRTLHGNDLSRCVKSIEADVGKMAKTSSQWLGQSLILPPTSKNEQFLTLFDDIQGGFYFIRCTRSLASSPPAVPSSPSPSSSPPKPLRGRNHSATPSSISSSSTLSRRIWRSLPTLLEAPRPVLDVTKEWT